MQPTLGCVLFQESLQENEDTVLYKLLKGTEGGTAEGAPIIQKPVEQMVQGIGRQHKHPIADQIPRDESEEALLSQLCRRRSLRARRGAQPWLRSNETFMVEHVRSCTHAAAVGLQLARVASAPQFHHLWQCVLEAST
jgi:hypothetical protein